MIAGLFLPVAHAQELTKDQGKNGAHAVSFSERERAIILEMSPLGPLPPDPTNRVADDPAAARLGQYLFFDKRLSGNGKIACADCHVPKLAFTDGKPLAEGMGTSVRGSPTLWNVGYGRWFGWTGKFDTLWSQAISPIEGPAEMGGSRLQVAHRLHDDPELNKAYEDIFGPLPPIADARRFPRRGRPVPGKENHPHQVAWSSMNDRDRHVVNEVIANSAKAIAAYERRITGVRSAFDEFVEGLRDGNAEKVRKLSPAAQRGLKLFIGPARCRLCHAGPNFTDGEFHNTQIAPRSGGRPRDPGRYEGIRLLRANPFNALGAYSDDPNGKVADRVQFLADNPDAWGQFKTPTLRNVARTAPYMHQGQLATLHDVVQFYSTLQGVVRAGHHQELVLVPLNLTDRQIDDLVAFLESLTDDSLDPSLMRQPSSPLLAFPDRVQRAEPDETIPEQSE